MALFRSKKKSLIEVTKKIDSEGILFTLIKQNEPVHLPITLTITELKKIDNLDQLQLLEDLWLEKKLVQKESNSYFLAYEYLYKLEPHERGNLELPESITPVDIELDNKSFVGSRNFKFIPKIFNSTYPNLHKIGRRKGAIIELPTNENLFIDEKSYDLFKLMDHAPSATDQELFAYIAQVRKKALSINIPVSEHIKREDYEFIDEVDIDLEREGDSISISPLFQHDTLDDEVLTEINEKQNVHTKFNNKRIFIDKKAKDQANKINNMKSIKGQDIPQFIQNPQSFIPEELDINMDQFGERVRGLGIRVYKAQPFIHADNSENGWFEYNTGFMIKDDEGNNITQEELDFFSESDNGEFKQLDDNTFISVPENAKEFTELSTKVLNEAENNRSDQLIPSNYILEIFENITNVEFNQPLHELKEALVNDQVFDKTPPAIFKAKLKPFQEDGFVWMKSLGVTGSGGLLADDMGLGKTIQVIAYFAYLKDRGQLGPSLLVLPKSLIDNWVHEMKKFAPVLTENLLVHLGSKRLKNHHSISQYDIVLTTYQTLTRDQLILGRVNWQVVMCDEAQAIKNPTTNVSIVVKALKNKRRLALTGTPVENNLSELWSIVDFVQPGLLGSLKEFNRNYESKLQDENSYDEVRDDIEKKIQFIYKRRTKASELKDQLPSKFEYKIPVSMGREQRHMYESLINQVHEKQIPAIQGIMKLKMLCSHPGLLDSTLKDGRKSKIPKLVETMKILKEVKKKGEKALIFTEYRGMQAILKQEIAKEFELNAAIINGGVDKRQQIVDHFNQNTGFDVLILSPKAAGTGLTITSANHVIHYTRWWNPAVENQATDRVYRIGQEKEVYVYYPIITGKKGGKTVEEVVEELLSKKKELAENVIVPSNDINIEQEILGKINIH